MGSCFAPLQKKVLDQRRWRTGGELRHAIINSIEHTYNRRRRQCVLGKLIAVEHELAFRPTTRRPRGLPGIVGVRVGGARPAMQWWR